MKPKVERGRRVVLWLGVACLGLLPMALSCSRQKTPGAEEAFKPFKRGWSHAVKGDQDQAIADFTEAIRLEPKVAAAYNNRGCAYAINLRFARIRGRSWESASDLLVQISGQVPEVEKSLLHLRQR